MNQYYNFNEIKIKMLISQNKKLYSTPQAILRNVSKNIN